MLVRALDNTGDWTFGKGLNDYKKNNAAIMQLLNTNLNEFLGNCFFNTGAGVNWFYLLGGKDQIALNIAISRVILNTDDVVAMNQLSVNVDPITRRCVVTYTVTTSYSSVITNTFALDPTLAG